MEDAQFIKMMEIIMWHDDVIENLIDIIVENVMNINCVINIVKNRS